MAKIGLNNFRYGLLTENPDGTASYEPQNTMQYLTGMNIPKELTTNKLGQYDFPVGNAIDWSNL